jgi:hypothetical protein
MKYSILKKKGYITAFIRFLNLKMFVPLWGGRGGRNPIKGPPRLMDVGQGPKRWHLGPSWNLSPSRNTQVGKGTPLRVLPELERALILRSPFIFAFGQALNSRQTFL